MRVKEIRILHWSQQTVSVNCCSAWFCWSYMSKTSSILFLRYLCTFTWDVISTSVSHIIRRKFLTGIGTGIDTGTATA